MTRLPPVDRGLDATAWLRACTRTRKTQCSRAAAFSVIVVR